MKTSYRKLWKLLIDRDMSKTDLRIRSGISSSTLAKLGKGDTITTAVLLKISEALDCDISEIMSSKESEEPKSQKSYSCKKKCSNRGTT